MGWVHALYLDQLQQLASGSGGGSDDRKQLHFGFERALQFKVDIVGHFCCKGRLRRSDFNWFVGTRNR